jgi:hypothetical protein
MSLARVQDQVSRKFLHAERKPRVQLYQQVCCVQALAMRHARRELTLVFCRIYGFYDECKRRYSLKLWKVCLQTNCFLLLKSVCVCVCVCVCVLCGDACKKHRWGTMCAQSIHRGLCHPGGNLMRHFVQRELHSRLWKEYIQVQHAYLIPGMLLCLLNVCFLFFHRQMITVLVLFVRA